MIYHEFLELMHTIVRQQSSAVLLADSEKASELAMAALGNAGDVYDACRDMLALQSDETNYATAAVIARLDKAYNRTKEPYIRDQIRLAIRQLRRLIEPTTIDNEPIDIFNI